MKITWHEHKKGEWYQWYAWHPVFVYEDDYSHLVWLEETERSLQSYGWWKYRLIKDD
jgi:hypothetical protein